MEILLEYFFIDSAFKVLIYSLLFSKIYSSSFLRRILFRVLESMPVESNWSWGYGRTVEEASLRKLYNLKDSDYVISTPNEIGINGILFKNLEQCKIELEKIVNSNK